MKRIGLLLLAVLVSAIRPVGVGADELVALQQGSGAPAARTPGASAEPPHVSKGPSETQLLKAELSKIRDELTQLQRQVIAVKSQLHNHEAWIQKRSGVVTSFCKDDRQTLVTFNGQSKSCAPYRCDEAWGSCYTRCDSRAECADLAACTPESYCTY